jgi:hypothetical protein
MSDIVERLRRWGAEPQEREAADEIERLRAALKIIATVHSPIGDGGHRMRATARRALEEKA